MKFWKEMLKQGYGFIELILALRGELSEQEESLKLIVEH